MKRVSPSDSFPIDGYDYGTYGGTMQSKECRDTSSNCKRTMLDSGMVRSDVIYPSLALAEPGSKSQPSEPTPPGLNEFDGLFHNSDGTRSFPDG